MMNPKNDGRRTSKWILLLAFTLGVLLLLSGTLLLFLPGREPEGEPTKPLLDGGAGEQTDVVLDLSSETVKSEDSETVDVPDYWVEGVLPQSSSFMSEESLIALFRTIPRRAWMGEEGWPWKYCYGTDTVSRVIDRIFELGLVDPDVMGNKSDAFHPSHPRIPYETVENLFREIWGPFFMSRYEDFNPDADVIDRFLCDLRAQLVYEESTNSYVFQNYPFSRSPDSAGDHFYARLMSVEREKEEIYAYVRFACYDTEAGEYSIYGEQGGWVINWDDRRTILARGRDGKDYQDKENSVFNRLHAGYFDEYLPVYRVTFRADEDGNFWWWQCMRTELGTEIPTELLTGTLPEAPSVQGAALPILGEKDSFSDYVGMQLAYFEDIYFYVTMEGRMVRYAKLPGHDETLTPAEKITNFSHEGAAGPEPWEAYTSVEYPNGFAILLRNEADGNVYHYYRLD